MAWLLPINIAWLIWICIRTAQSLGDYGGVHTHAYAWLFISGLMVWMVGSLLLKWVWFEKKTSLMATTGFGFWIVGFLLLGTSTLFGSNIPSVHILQEHVIFGHVNFIVFLGGLILSAYLDFRIISMFAPFSPIRIGRTDMNPDNNK